MSKKILFMIWLKWLSVKLVKINHFILDYTYDFLWPDRYTAQMVISFGMELNGFLCRAGVKQIVSMQDSVIGGDVVSNTNYQSSDAEVIKAAMGWSSCFN